MKLTQLVGTRRSCRKYLDRKVDRSLMESILEATLKAPSSKNMRTSRFVVVTDRAQIQLLGGVRNSGSSAFVAGAPVVVIVMADTSADALYVENSSISATFIQLLAHEHGLGSCWVQIEGRPHDESQPDGMSAQEFVEGVVAQTKGYRIECLIAIGYPDGTPRPHKEHDDSDKIIWL